jgi:hypothetical protein
LCAAGLSAGAEGEQPAALISDDYQIMRDGDVLGLKQGYGITLKGFSSTAVLVEFHNDYGDNLSIGSAVLKESETVRCYRITDTGKTEILRLTLDKLYLNNSQVIVGFSDIYQFEDTNGGYTEETVWTLETAAPDNPSNPQTPDSEENPGNVGQELIAKPIYIIITISLATIVLIGIIILFRKKEKAGQRKRTKRSKKKDRKEER